MGARRDFIKKTTVAAIGMGLPGSINAMTAKSYNNILGANQQVTFGEQTLNYSVISKF